MDDGNFVFRLLLSGAKRENSEECNAVTAKRENGPRFWGKSLTDRGPCIYHVEGEEKLIFRI